MIQHDSQRESTVGFATNIQVFDERKPTYEELLARIHELERRDAPIP